MRKLLLQNSITSSNNSNAIAFEASSCSSLFASSNKRKKSNTTGNSKLTVVDSTVNLINTIDHRNALDLTSYH